MHLPHNANDNFAKLRILFVPTTTTIFLFSPSLQTRLWGYGYRHMRSLAPKVVRSWLNRVGVQTLFITPGSPWENGYIESVNGRLRNELLDLELFDPLWEVKVLVERWRQTYNRIDLTVRWAIDHRHRKPSGHIAPDSHSGRYNYRGQVTCTP